MTIGKFIFYLLLIETIILVALCFSGVRVFAADPITQLESISIEDIRVFRNLAEDGDMLFVFQYDIAFVSDNYSTTPASDSILFRLYDTDGTTLLATGSPYVYAYFNSNGYGDGVGSFYLSSTDNQCDWGDEVNINIYPSPSYFEDPGDKESNNIVTVDRYTTLTSQEDNQDALKEFVLLLCDRLESAYSDTGIILKTSSDSGIVLSQYGESYFRGAINGLQNLSPELFFIQVYIPEQITTQDYDMSLAETYGERLDADDLGKGFTRLGEYIGTNNSGAAALILILISIAFCIWCIRKNWNIEIGLAGAGLIGLVFALIIGDMIFTLVMLGSLVSVMGVVWLVQLKRA